MGLYSLLACPGCHGALVREGGGLRCAPCSTAYPIALGVPIFIDQQASDLAAAHEAELRCLPGYAKWKERQIIKALLDDQVVVDVGAGNQSLDDPCIIRMDVGHHPFVDVVGDVHRLPFRDGSVDFVLAGAVFEHLHQPFEAAGEIFRVLKPGGYVYADCNFLFAYHGYPHHYFGATPQGLRSVFRHFTALDVGVAPFQKPSFAMESIVDAYVKLLRVEDEEDGRFVRHLHRLLRFPLREYDVRLGDQAFRLAAGCYFFGVKQPAGHETVLPAAVLDAWRADAALQSRFKQPLDISVPDNLMTWARAEGRHADPRISAALDSSRRFCKWEDAARPWDRSTVASWPLELMTEPDPAEIDHVRRHYALRRRSWGRKLTDAFAEGGLPGVIRRTARHLRWRVDVLRGRSDH